MAQEMSIGELAAKTGLTRRVIRFYVQRELIPPPRGKGRGSFYTTDHLELISRIQEFQAAGYSLDAISELLQQSPEVELVLEERLADEVEVQTHKSEAFVRLPGKEKSAPRHIQLRAQRRLKEELWKRVKVMPGVELNIDVSRHDLNESILEKLKQTVISEVTRSGNNRTGGSDDS